MPYGVLLQSLINLKNFYNENMNGSSNNVESNFSTKLKSNKNNTVNAEAMTPI